MSSNYKYIGNTAKLYVNGTFKAQYSYSATFTGGKVGFRAANASTYFDNFMVSAAETSRTTYTLGGQAIATRVTGDPTAANNGLFYIFSDHLGSTSALAYGSGGQTGQKVPGSKASYYPFGSPRTAPTQTITDRNFTGQKENMELGLIYYNARFYLPAIARFLTPDTLIPRPTDPQSFNRYAYTRNNPTRFTDPSGHVCYDPITDAATPGCTQPSPQQLAGVLVSFQVVENVDEVWTAVEKAVIYQAAYDVGKAFANNLLPTVIN